MYLILRLCDYYSFIIIILLLLLLSGPEEIYPTVFHDDVDTIHTSTWLQVTPFFIPSEICELGYHVCFFYLIIDGYTIKYTHWGTITQIVSQPCSNKVI